MFSLLFSLQSSQSDSMQYKHLYHRSVRQCNSCLSEIDQFHRLLPMLEQVNHLKVLRHPSFFQLVIFFLSGSRCGSTDREQGAACKMADVIGRLPAQGNCCISVWASVFMSQFQLKELESAKSQLSETSNVSSESRL